MLRQLRSRARAAVLAAAIVTPLALPAQGAAPRRVTSVEGITEYQLANGLRVLLFPDASKPTVTVNITYLVGSRHEAYGETGMAHLLEHLVFKGTPTRKDIPAEMSAHGARFNGTTWYDRTNYYETMPASDENLTWALDLEADRMVHSNIAKSDLVTEFTVVRNEFEAGENNPFGILMQRVIATMYLWHNYGQSTIGARSDIENVPIERLQAFYRKYYQPDNAILVVAGKFDEAKTLQIVQEKFGRIPRPERSLDRGNLLFATYTREPVQDGERTVTLRRTGDVQVAMAGYHTVAAPHPDFAAVDVLSTVLGAVPTGRLHQALVEPQKASNTGAFLFPLREPGFILAFAQLRKEQDLAEARRVLQATIEGVATTPPTAEEVQRAKAELLKDIELTLNNSERVGLDLTEWAAAGDWRLLFLHRDRVEKVTPADVERVAKAYLKPANATIGMFYPTDTPDRAEITEAPDPARLVAGYTGRAVVAAGEAFEATPANIAARTTRTALPNGFKVQLLPKETRGDVVRGQLVLRYGTERTLDADKARLGQLMGQMVTRGTATKTRAQIKDEFDRLKARVNVNGSGQSVGATIEVTREHLVPTLRLVAEVLRQPSFPADEFAQLKTQTLAQLEAQKQEPQVRAVVAWQQKTTPWPVGHVNRPSTIEESIAGFQAATRDEVAAFHRDFVGASYGDLTLVGDFAADSVAALARELFGDWKSPQPYERIRWTAPPVPASAEEIETPDKANAMYVAGFTFPMSDESPDYAAMLVANYVVGGGPLDSRLPVRLRQKDGISYGAGSQFSARPVDASAQWLAFAIYNPENLARLETGVREELERVRKDGITAEELERAKKAILQERTQQRANDGELASALAGQLFWNRTMAFDAALDAKLSALTAAQVNAALRTHLDPAKLVVVKAGDFAKARAKAGTVRP
jgi:zinc protease